MQIPSTQPQQQVAPIRMQPIQSPQQSTGSPRVQQQATPPPAQQSKPQAPLIDFDSFLASPSSPSSLATPTKQSTPIPIGSPNISNSSSFVCFSVLARLILYKSDVSPMRISRKSESSSSDIVTLSPPPSRRSRSHLVRQL